MPPAKIGNLSYAPEKRGIMRAKYLSLAAVSVASMAAPFIFAGQAQAASPVETLIAGTNSGLCISDNNVHPGSTPAYPILYLVGCNGSNGNDQFYATASSYGAGWYSIVSNDHASSSGSYCITDLSDGAFNGEPAVLSGCDGQQHQAWKRACLSNGTELESAAGYALNDYGGHGANDDQVATWHFENPAPKSLIFTESQHDMGTC
jgi:hypothetical protein